jgi:ppGpp synthetase/RelA/SpoT-type nucleotidyltranferase
MEIPEKKLSGMQITKAGALLIDENIVNDPVKFEEAMDVLSHWRFLHDVPLSKAFNLIEKEILSVDKKAFFAKRLKRHASIVKKLKRFDSMNLRKMQDIGGCRAILSNPKKLDQVVRALRSKSEFKNSAGKIKYKNYIEKPKEDGYRSYHIIGNFKDKFDEIRQIEVQLRTALQHDWATALEIVDIFTGQALKSNQGDMDWKIFFRVVSEQFAIMEKVHLFNPSDKRKINEYLRLVNDSKLNYQSCATAQDYSNKLEVVKKFNAFANSVKIVGDILEKSVEAGYVLIEVDTLNKQVKSTLFKIEGTEHAEVKYIEAEKKAAANKNLVVALVSASTVGGIKDAFPNYFADSTDFLRHLLIITSAPIKKPKGVLSRLFGGS